jgi:hypothetical protein
MSARRSSGRAAARLFAGGLVVVAIWVSVLVGRAAIEMSPGAGTATSTPRPVIRVSQVRQYGSLGQLRAESDAIAMVIPDTAEVSTLHGIPITLTKVRIVSLIDGRLPAGEFVIQQFGSTNVDSPNTSSLLQVGQTYVAFVQAFHLTLGDDTGRFVVTADQGLYRLVDGSYVNVGAPSRLPARLAGDDLEQFKSG